MSSSVTATIAQLLARLPEVDQPGKASKFTGPSPEVTDDLFEETLASGRKGLRELARLVRAPGDPDFQNYRAGYLLHALAMHVGAPGKEAERHLITDAITSALSQKELTSAAKTLLIRELQSAGDAEAIKPLEKCLDDEVLCEPATQALLAIGGKSVGESLSSALRSARGQNRTCLVQALGALREADSVKLLLSLVSDPDLDTRLATGWALANIGLPNALEPLLQAAEKPAGWERIQATNACLLLAERLLESGKKAEARRIYAQLRDTRKDPSERHIREAAERALA